MTEAASTGAVTPGTPWYGTAVDAELSGYIQNRGWHEGKVEDIALAAIKAHREASVKIGLPPEQVLRLPKDANDTNGWKPVWNRLGVPADAKEYDFTGLKYADGTEVEPALVDAIRANAFASNVTKDGAKSFAAGLVKFYDAQRAEALAARTAAANEGRETLKKNWGTNFDANKVMADRGVQTIAKLMGLDADATKQLAVGLSALENQAGVGYSRVMEMFRVIGNGMREDSFVPNGGGGPNNGVMTRDQAAARIAELKNDDAWKAKVLAGDTAANRELMDLNKIVNGDDTEDSRRASGR